MEFTFWSGQVCGRNIVYQIYNYMYIMATENKAGKGIGGIRKSSAVLSSV